MAPTPAIAALDRSGAAYTLHRYRHDARSSAYGSEAAERLAAMVGARPEQVCKTLVVQLRGGPATFAVGVLGVSETLSLKAMAAALGASRAHMANPADVSRLTGYVLGGVSPLGQRTTLPTVLDDAMSDQDRVFVSAGRRGLEVGMAPADLATVTAAVWADVQA